jgi:uncharacterized protein (DUF362 family)
MSGCLSQGAEDFEAGEKDGAPLSFDVTIEIDSVSDFIRLSGQEARMTGTVSCHALGDHLPVREGLFTLFKPDAVSGKKQMTYSFCFTAKDGTDYSLYGYKVVYDDPGMDAWEDMTKLFTRLYRGKGRKRTPFGSGILRFKILDLPSMLTSFEVTRADSPLTKIRTISSFAQFCYGAVKPAYLPGLFYATRYENLALSGNAVSKENRPCALFFFSGIHDRDFPWGDGETFSDIGLLLQGQDGDCRSYALSDRVIENLTLDVEKGICRYEGPLYRVAAGHRLARSDLEKSPLPPHLAKVTAGIEIRFESRPCPAVDLPFPVPPGAEEFIPQLFFERAMETLRRLGTPGLRLIPHRVRVLQGEITLQQETETETFTVKADETGGEAEIATLKNIRWPTLYFHYSCALDPGSGRIYIRIRSDAFRKNRTDYLKDRTEQLFGKIVSHAASMDLEILGDRTRLLSEDEVIPFAGAGESLLEINHDHFPTATFRRRVARMMDDRGRFFCALEEDMDPHILRAVHSERWVRAAAIKDRDKFSALNGVLEATGFFGKLDRTCVSSGKSKEDFAVVIKPNFMFTYSKADPSTYTDPELVEYLVDRIRERGYGNLAVAEARSTYGTFFTHRDVKTVAGYIGLTGRNYRIVDLSENLEAFHYAGKLGNHFVNREWKNADFRISFAKNKTHVYAYYTLTIKNIYGALPIENKFLEYHHRRDIFSTTIEFIRRFPIHFALIDAHVSADGPFGIFADKHPNRTETLIGSEDIVAADWVGAEKMGLDPMVSDYMKQAVEAFGKPEIELVGDRAIYRDWVNVWDVFPPFLFGGMDKHYYFGNLFYSVFSHMDPEFRYKDPSLAKRFLRILADPIKELFFQKTREGVFDQNLNRRLYELFTGQG